MKGIGTLFLLLTATACVTAMGERGIEHLTTCESQDWTQVKASLARNGYVLQQESEALLETEFRGADDFGSERTMRKITVTKEPDGRIRFKERVRTVRRDDGMLMGGGMGSRRPGVSVGIGLNFGDAGETTRESDQEYYDERRAEYEAVQREVCGP